MSSNRAGTEYVPFTVDYDDDEDHTLVPRPQKRRRAPAKGHKLRRVLLPLLAGLVVGLGLGHMGFYQIPSESNYPVVSSSNDPVSTVFDSFEDINHESPVFHPNWTLTTPHERAVVTSLYNDGYALGVAMMGYSLSKVKSQARKIVIYMPGRISEGALCRIRATGWELLPVDRIPPPNDGVGVWQEFEDQYTKLRIWALDQLGIKSAVYLDADVLVLKNFDELFELPFVFAAAPDIYDDDRGFIVDFNAGVMAVKPDSEVFRDMLSKVEDAKFDRAQAEQSYLNLYYGSQVVRLPHIYNGNLAFKAKSRSYWAAMKEQMRTIHYTLVKPFDRKPQCGDRLCEGDEMFDPSRQKDLLEGAKASWDGLFREELERWIAERDETLLALGNSCA